MAETLDQTSISISLAATLNNLQSLFSSVSAPFSLPASYGWSTGTGAAQADRAYVAQPTIAASGTLALDLAGSLVDALGQTITMARVKAIYVAASAANTNNVTVGGAATNAFVNWVGAATHTVSVRPGGSLLLVAPDAVAYAVTAGTGDILQLANSAAGTSVTANVVIIGASA